jgi:hypothetical protein
MRPLFDPQQLFQLATSDPQQLFQLATSGGGILQVLLAAAAAAAGLREFCRLVAEARQQPSSHCVCVCVVSVRGWTVRG